MSVVCASGSSIFVGRNAAALTSAVEIVVEPHCLSEESARGYRMLVDASIRMRPGSIIVPASRRLTLQNAREFQRRVGNGAWLVVESGDAYWPLGERENQVRILKDVFGLFVREPVAIGAGGTYYVTFNGPRRLMVRTFGAITPVECTDAERLAEFEGRAVACRRRMGKGGVIFLGSILGVGLLAQEREAHELVRGLLVA